jgi:ABC-type oligopeptide transport system substrate-binding subunit
MRALDRILLWNHCVVPQWYYNNVRSARWDRFGHPDLMPKYGTAALYWQRQQWLRDFEMGSICAPVAASG